jgi:hypothetical protein
VCWLKQGALTNKAGESSGKKEGSGMVSPGVQVSVNPGGGEYVGCGGGESVGFAGS